ncbi:hypothetical protein FisN_4Lh367 [Fistulifera solaris]|uniref:THO complex subunit 5 n=1 Tax=Fistulifera solaris TaxID=1519565 RepID=A0A1Z5JZY9_FISSO|nr:hypothetical protein FisN_4Lh367 [Fistulifera solaris]|eukprot:GAX19388.1 hypothetical protein FisN_4Lh367 [Fistulifera solaris]
MSPPKKRVKLAAAAADAAAAAESSLSGDVNLESIDGLFSKIISKLKTMNSGNAKEDGTNLMLSFMKLKAWQNELLEKLDVSQTELTQAITRKERQERALAALVYEKDQLDRELVQCREFELKYLKKLAGEEVGPDCDGNTETFDQEALFVKYLNANVHDPNDKQKIIATLHQEITARGSFERDLKLNEGQLERIKKDLAINASFLKSLPDNLSVIERATMPLQKFMAHKTPQGTLPVARMIGTDRRRRLDLARLLCGPLYTLFAQLQHYLDRPVRPESAGNSFLSCAETMSLSISPDDSTHSEVILHIPIPNILNSSTAPGQTKKVLIHFRYYEKHNVITAFASGAKTTLNQEILLDELFPNDYPDSIADTDGRPYHWCNYLGGLHVTYKKQESTSLGVVLRALERRIRANETLKHILHQLERCYVPQTSGKETPCRLIKFEATEEGENNKRSLEKTYTVVFVPRTSDAQFIVSVCIHMARYPAVPPRWMLSGSHLVTSNDWNVTDSPLYDTHLASLERYVNADGLVELLQNSLSPIRNDEANYEWILLYQLRCICERIATNYNVSQAGTRQFKGRDHAPIDTQN